MFRHVVMVTFNENMTPEALAAYRAGLDEFGTQVPQLRRFAHGPDAGLADDNYDYVVVSDFDSVDDYITYRDCDAHQHFLATYAAGKLSGRAAVQYEF